MSGSTMYRMYRYVKQEERRVSSVRPQIAQMDGTNPYTVGTYLCDMIPYVRTCMYEYVCLYWGCGHAHTYDMYLGMCEPAVTSPFLSFFGKPAFFVSNHPPSSSRPWICRFGQSLLTYRYIGAETNQQRRTMSDE